MEINPVIEYYDKLATAYDDDRFANSYGSFIDKRERKLLEAWLDREGTIIDLACGSGRFSEFASVGIDASEQMLQVARRKFPEKSFVCADAEILPFADASVDTIFSFHLLMHLSEEKTSRILQECHRILKPGGKLIVDFPSAKRRELFRYKASGWHGATSFTLAQMKSVSGFKPVKSEGILFLPIHRFPKQVRRFFTGIDAVLSRSFIREYSSYLVICLEKI